MTAVLIHPTGKRPTRTPVPVRNWARTIAQAVDLERDPAAQGLDREQRALLRAHHPEGRAHLWGAKALHAGDMRRLKEGDVVLLTGDSQVQALGRVGVVLEAPAFGSALWPEAGPDGYVYVYTLHNLTFPVGLTYDEVMRRSGTTAMSFRGLNLRTGARAAQVLDGLRDVIPPLGPRNRPDVVRALPVDVVVEAADGADLAESGADEPNPGESELLARLEAMGSTDAAGAVRAVRREQSLLRDWLGIGSSAGDTPVQCGLCGRYLPRGLLVAAHVKPRAICTDEERRDMPSVAMAACVLGCDALYEAGYVAVDDAGRIITARRTLPPSQVHAILRGLEGRRAPAWTPGREPYFAWHRANRLPAGALGQPLS